MVVAELLERFVCILVSLLLDVPILVSLLPRAFFKT